MAALALEYQQTGLLIARPALHQFGTDEVVGYGPVYYWCMAKVFEVFGFGLSTYRAVPLLAGLGCVGLGTWLGRWLLGLSSGQTIVLGLALAHDPFLVLSMHEGRMDTCVLLGQMAAIGTWVRAWQRSRPGDLWISGLLTGLCVLTSPRGGFVLPFLALAIGWTWWRRPLLRRACLGWWAAWLIPYLCWMIYTFGSPQAWLAYYVQLSGYVKQSLVFYVPRHQWLLLAATGLLGLTATFFAPRSMAHPLVIASVAALLLFHLLVYDQGPYSVLVIPYLYWILIRSIQVLIGVNHSKKNPPDGTIPTGASF